MPIPGTGQADYLDLGDWNCVCSMCGRKRKASKMVQNWQGMYRCPEHNEPRQPQDFVRGVSDDQTPPWTQPPGTDQFGVLTYSSDGTGSNISATGGSSTTGPFTIITINPGQTVPIITITNDSLKGGVILNINPGGVVAAILNPDAVPLTIHNWGGGYSLAYLLTIAGGVDVNVYDKAVIAGLPVSAAISIYVYITDAITASSSANGALTWDDSHRWHIGTTFHLINQSTITGANGTGGQGNANGVGSNGGTGGNAVELNGYTVTIVERGTITAGAGGGGGGGAAIGNTIAGTPVSLSGGGGASLGGHQASGNATVEATNGGVSTGGIGAHTDFVGNLSWHIVGDGGNGGSIAQAGTAGNLTATGGSGGVVTITNYTGGTAGSSGIEVNS